MKDKKPTMMQVKNVLSSIIKEMENLKNHYLMIDNLILKYFEFKKDKDSFKEWMEKENKKEKKS